MSQDSLSNASTTSIAIPEGMYEVEKIIAHKVERDLMLLVRWSGYGPADDTWEPEREVRVNASEAVLDYYDKLKKAEKLELIDRLNERIAENEQKMYEKRLKREKLENRVAEKLGSPPAAKKKRTRGS